MAYVRWALEKEKEVKRYSHFGKQLAMKANIDEKHNEQFSLHVYLALGRLYTEGKESFTFMVRCYLPILKIQIIFI